MIIIISVNIITCILRITNCIIITKQFVNVLQTSTSSFVSSWYCDKSISHDSPWSFEYKSLPSRKSTPSGSRWMDGWLRFNGILSTQVAAISCLVVYQPIQHVRFHHKNQTATRQTLTVFPQCYLKYVGLSHIDLVSPVRVNTCDGTDDLDNSNCNAAVYVVWKVGLAVYSLAFWILQFPHNSLII